MSGQALLAGELDRHLQRALAASDEGDGLCAIVVIRELEPLDFVAGTLGFAAAIASEVGARWRRSFTKTLFFAGNPAALTERFEFDHLSPSGAIGWIGPVPEEAHPELRRMLRLFEAPLSAERLLGDLEATVPGEASAPEPRSLLVATDGVPVDAVLIHLNHTLCEAALRGLVGPGDRLLVRRRDRIEPEAIEAAGADRRHCRVAPESGDQTELRLYALLAPAEEIEDALV